MVGIIPFLNFKIPALRIRRPQAEAIAEVRLWRIERQRNPAGGGFEFILSLSKGPVPARKGRDFTSNHHNILVFNARTSKIKGLQRKCCNPFFMM
jgi:hypothetical protein